MKIAFVGGGTAGHVFPLVSLFFELKDKAEIIYFAAENTVEEKLAKQNDIPVIYILKNTGMPRSLSKIFWIVKLIFITFKTLHILKQEKPDLILSTGGYASSSILLAAKFLKIPYVLHNLDAHIGLANKFFLDSAEFISFGMKPLHSFKKITCPVIITGNPVREEFYQNINKQDIYKKYNLNSQKKILLLTGGSQGSLIISKILWQIIPELVKDNWQIVHQVGKVIYNQQEYKNIWSYLTEEFQENYQVYEFIEELPELYKISDLYIGRSGAMTISELLVSNTPSILIPLPKLAQNHQYYNAKYLEDLGGAVLLEQDKLTSENLLQNISSVFGRIDQMKESLKNNLNKTKPSEQLGKLIMSNKKSLI